jgi:hypothetical protein
MMYYLLLYDYYFRRCRLSKCDVFVSSVLPMLPPTQRGERRSSTSKLYLNIVTVFCLYNVIPCCPFSNKNERSVHDWGRIKLRRPKYRPMGRAVDGQLDKFTLLSNMNFWPVISTTNAEIDAYGDIRYGKIVCYVVVSTHVKRNRTLNRKRGISALLHARDKVRTYHNASNVSGT